MGIDDYTGHPLYQFREYIPSIYTYDSAQARLS